MSAFVSAAVVAMAAILAVCVLSSPVEVMSSCASLIWRIAATVVSFVSERSRVPAICFASISATINVADSSAVSFNTSLVTVASPRSTLAAAALPAETTAASIVSTNS